MKIYHHEKMSDDQKVKTKEYDRKKTAVYRSKKKELEQSKREKCKIRQMKFQKHIEAICRIAKQSPKKQT